jgi:copper chaperone NosL
VRAFAAPLLATIFLYACAKGPLAPVPLPLDRFNCARCGMLISELDDAAEWVGRGEELRFYDDLGCAAADASRVPPGGKFFVRASGGRRWLPAELAVFAKPAGARTPMSYGLVAFETEADAKARDAQGRSLRWADLAGFVRARGAGESR